MEYPQKRQKMGETVLKNVPLPNIATTLPFSIDMLAAVAAEIEKNGKITNTALNTQSNHALNGFAAGMRTGNNANTFLTPELQNKLLASQTNAMNSLALFPQLPFSHNALNESLSQLPNFLEAQNPLQELQFQHPKAAVNNNTMHILELLQKGMNDTSTRDEEEIVEEKSDKSSIPSTVTKREKTTNGKAALEIWKGSLSLPVHISILKAVANFLTLDRRRQPSWSSVGEHLEKTHGVVVQFNVKMKVYAGIGKRRMRLQTQFWKDLRALLEYPEDATRLIGNMLWTMFNGAQNILHWEFTKKLAEYLHKLLEKNQDTPGSILDWPQPIRSIVVDKLIELHKLPQYGNRFHSIHHHFRKLWTVSEIELGILSECKCKDCIANWNLSTLKRSCNVELQHHWIKEKANFVVQLLEMHLEHGQGLYELADSHLKKMKGWARDDIDIMLVASHPSRDCPVCRKTPTDKVKKFKQKN
mmetsp:Transcript_6543/g.11505  ORF Transcript_6543/g.11505 Transcript_6543/m.11505 type:complete len:472 (+) Transcript_6543:4216-5631(+)|eukprot:CAMPEP_0203765268 /NCGR_PEP_ID=MMETSP0098-20131031/18321_1 /ASSEMBLY_ACC=CAM_ASM_000208 /TAXON_ID=96639 /ORGANISM=" , Strain NY0313808BC1" /LENGTH=471 /DNA_ID=CAMNT_0050661505 /DNA_START=281 /DNA_END=1696 /DNA_ORIENTATION=-